MLITVVWLDGFLSSIVTYIVRGRSLNLRGGVFTQEVAGASLTNYILQLAILLLSIAAIAPGFRDKVRSQLFGGVILVLAPGLSVVTLSAYFNGETFSRQWLQYPLVVIALWFAGGWRDITVLVARLTTLSAIMSLALGMFSPFGLMVPDWRTDNKAIIGDTILAGQYNHPNALAITLALGLPFVLMSSTWRSRLGALPVIAAITWSSARSILVATALVVILSLAIYLIKSERGRTRILNLALTCSLLYAILVPLFTQNPAAFTNRGEIWQASLTYSREYPILGLGPLAYLKIDPLTNRLGFLPSHGHNLFVTTVTVGGITGLALLAFALYLSWTRIRASDASYLVTKLALISTILCSALESTLQFQSVYQMTFILWPLIAHHLMPATTNEVPPAISEAQTDNLHREGHGSLPTRGGAESDRNKMQSQTS
jgi:O-antigen ligase